MSFGEVRHVAHPPSKPLMLFDGDCHFCRRWIERWREATGGRVDYVSAQEAGSHYPEISAEEFAGAVQFIETNGSVYRGAEAVIRALRYRRGGKALGWVYDSVPGFAAVSEGIYSVVARNRGFASRATRLLWGDDVRRPTYQTARRGFLKSLGLIYLFAFISVWVQVDGLMGERGILPASEMLGLMRNASGQPPLTLCALDSSSTTLHALCVVGSLSAALLAFGFVPIPALLVCFVSYVSLVNAGQLFFSYQWDILLLETGFVAFFIAPWQWRLRRGRDAPVSRLARLLVLVLLFKLMFMSGVVKLTSGDSSWLDLSALDYHYWTQPLPTVFAWFADQNPVWLKKFSVAATLFVEMVVPFFIWAPRRLRLIAAGLLIALQVAIALTGNYCFFNLLTIILCLLLIDDLSWSRETAGEARPWPVAVPAAVLLVTLPLNAWLTFLAVKPAYELPRFLQVVHRPLRSLAVLNEYGLFRVMTKDRPEIIFEGSADAFDWHPYEFKWKPGDVMRMPQWNAPHQPRLDWSMWFAALGSRRDAFIVERFAERLLRNQPEVLGLLEKNPFPEKPPQFIRASLHAYRFTSSEERKETGAWWKRDLRRQYLPTVSLRDFAR